LRPLVFALFGALEPKKATIHKGSSR
jgi:hypothetical protein